VALTMSAWLMLQRNLLYTAVTRAKQLVVLVGSRRALAKAVRTQGAGRRYTALTQRSARTRTSRLKGDRSEAPEFGDRISRRRQSVELGHQLPAQARRFIAWLGSRRSGQGSTP
jgi:hypothetical protein